LTGDGQSLLPIDESLCCISSDEWRPESVEEIES
jgi:hypothetical protein